MARPRIEIDLEQFQKLCAIQCTLSEIASWFKCSEDTIENWCKRELKRGFSDAYKNFSANGKISLRRTQFRLAEHNVSMAIWLGKQYLGQKERIETNIIENIDDSMRRMDEYFSNASTGIDKA